MYVPARSTRGPGDQRNKREFADYFAARRDAVRRTAYLICGDWRRADDLAQTAFVALHRRWRKVRDKGALDSYLRRTLARAAIDESRRPWRRERSPTVAAWRPARPVRCPSWHGS
ncbi:MAG: sigma factor [Lysobacter sp.]